MIQTGDVQFQVALQLFQKNSGAWKKMKNVKQDTELYQKYKGWLQEKETRKIRTSLAPRFYLELSMPVNMAELSLQRMLGYLKKLARLLARYPREFKKKWWTRKGNFALTFPFGKERVKQLNSIFQRKYCKMPPLKLPWNITPERPSGTQRYRPSKHCRGLNQEPMNHDPWGSWAPVWLQYVAPGPRLFRKWCKISWQNKVRKNIGSFKYSCICIIVPELHLSVINLRVQVLINWLPSFVKMVCPRQPNISLLDIHWIYHNLCQQGNDFLLSHNNVLLLSIWNYFPSMKSRELLVCEIGSDISCQLH